MNLVIPDALDGERIDRVLATLTGITRAAAVQALQDGRVGIEGEFIRTKSRSVVAGEELSFDEVASPVESPRPESGIDFEVVYEDADLLVVNKPAGLVVHPGAGNPSRTLVNGLLERFSDIDANRPGQSERPGIVHRLDAGTTGLLVVSRNEKTHEALVELLKERNVERRYIALVWGDVRPDIGAIDAPIGRAQRHRTRMAVSLKGKLARTSYIVTDRADDPEVTLMEAKLETGRTHQVRVHFAAIGHALVGDRRYNGYRQPLPFDRPFLHAARLSFEHPISKEFMTFSAPLPKDMAQLLSTLDLESTGLGEIER